MELDNRTVIQLFRNNHKLPSSPPEDYFIGEEGNITGVGVGLLSDTYNIPIDKVYEEILFYQQLISDKNRMKLKILKGIKEGQENNIIETTIKLSEVDFFLKNYAQYDTDLIMIKGVSNIEKIINASEIKNSDSRKQYVAVLNGTENLSKKFTTDEIINKDKVDYPRNFTFVIGDRG